jgi:hypothetical protein
MFQEPHERWHDNDQPRLHAGQEEAVPELPGVESPSRWREARLNNLLCHGGGVPVTQGQTVAWHCGNLVPTRCEDLELYLSVYNRLAVFHCARYEAACKTGTIRVPAILVPVLVSVWVCLTVFCTFFFKIKCFFVCVNGLKGILYSFISVIKGVYLYAIFFFVMDAI